MELDLNKYPWINPAVQAVSQLSQSQQPARNNIPYPQIQQPPQYQKTQNPSEYEQNAGYFSNITPNFLAGVNETDIPNRNALLDARNIFAAKKSWEDADRIESRLTEMLNDKNLTADQKNLLNLKLIDAQNVKKNSSDYADYANMLRNGGFNLYGFGAENTVGESAQALHNYQQRGMENLLNLPSYQERAFDKKMELAQSGMKPCDINFALEKYELPKIKREMANQYRDGVALYGMNPDGSLNEFGAEILSRMADVNPTSANAYSSLFANPKDTFAANQNMLQNIFNQDNANYRAGMQRDQNIWQSLFNAANTRQNLLTSLGYDYGKHQDNLQYNYDNLNSTNAYRENQIALQTAKSNADLALKEAERFDKSETGKLYGTVQALMAAGYTEQEAVQMARAAFVRKLVGEKGQPTETAAATGVKSLFNSLYNLIDSGNEADAVEMFNQFEQQRSADYVEYYKNIGDEVQSNLLDFQRKAFAEYLTEVGRATDEKSKRNAKITLAAKIRAANEGDINKWKDFRDAFMNAGHKVKDRLPENQNTEIGNNSKVRNELNSGNNSNGSSGGGSFGKKSINQSFDNVFIAR